MSDTNSIQIDGVQDAQNEMDELREIHEEVMSEIPRVEGDSLEEISDEIDSLRGDYFEKHTALKNALIEYENHASGREWQLLREIVQNMKMMASDVDIEARKKYQNARHRFENADNPSMSPTFD